jgi:DNA-directed RNA polymerase specialized sigma subunit
MLMNFCDSAFTIGESNADSSLRYLKQIKQRNTEQVYGESNICLCRIGKPHNFLQYDFVEFSEEWQQLLKRKKSEPDGETMAKVLAFKEQNYSLREIGRELGISHQKVDRMLKAHAANM